MNAIETQGLKRVFGKNTAVADLNLQIPAGAVFGFLGPNGAGKTTTVRMLAALISPTAGTATVAGHRVGRDDDAIRASVGILTETPGLYERLTALQNLVFFARLYGLDSTRAATQAERYLKMMDLWDRRRERVGGFSKGMRQKIAIARALLHEPQVVFLDEPTAGLDTEASRTVRDFIKELRSEGRTIFLTTHNLPEADELCDLIAVFRTHVLRLDTPDRLRTGLFGGGTLVRVVGAAAPWTNTVAALPFVREVKTQDDRLTVSLDNPDEQNPALVRALVTAGADVRAVQPVTHSLEQVYLELVRDHEGGSPASTGAI